MRRLAERDRNRFVRSASELGMPLSLPGSDLRHMARAAETSAPTAVTGGEWSRSAAKSTYSCPSGKSLRAAAATASHGRLADSGESVEHPDIDGSGTTWSCAERLVQDSRLAAPESCHGVEGISDDEPVAVLGGGNHGQWP
jgi:hypothetical protein